MLPRRPLIIVALCSLLAIVVLSAGARVAAENEAERVFRKARGYTVRIRTQITQPFMLDTRGSCEGAGFLVDRERGWIVTNAHVVGQSPSEVQVAFADEPFQPARKVYVDPFTDVAVLSVEKIPPGSSVAELDRKDDVRVGEPVGAYGHPLGMRFTGTRGIVSGKTDQYGPDLIQIDATVDHGNSGGPTISLRDGRVIGIATAMTNGSRADRLNFATPMQDVSRILSLLRAGTEPSPPFIEFALLRDDNESHTLEVGASFNPQRWPLEAGDLIVGVEGEPTEIKTLSHLFTAFRGRCGKKVPMIVERGGKRITVEATPSAVEPVLAQRGISVDGALIAPLQVEDGVSLREPAWLFVHSVNPGSDAESVGIQTVDVLHTVDGRVFTDLDSLSSYLAARPRREPIRIVLRRTSGFVDRIHDYHVRDLPGEDIQPVGPDPGKVAASQN